MNTIGDRIKKIMNEKGITSYSLYRKTGVSQTTIGRILRNQGKPNRTTLEPICKALEISFNWLVNENDAYVSNLDTIKENNPLILKKENTPYFTSKHEKAAEEDIISLLKAQLKDKDKTIAGLEETIKAKNELIEFLKNQNSPNNNTNKKSK